MGEPDAYHLLQVEPTADDAVIHAAFRALARRLHPDGIAPDAGRMAELNRAYALVREPHERRSYDRRRADLRAVGPGPRTSASASVPPPDGDGFFARAARRSGRETGEASPRLDFGRYMGWSLAELARHDPDYLRWLTRHSSGLRYRGEIQRELRDLDAAGRDRATA